MASVERVVEYTELEKEGVYEDKSFVQPDWPR